VPFGRHAVERVRTLFAKSLGYALPDGPGEYGLDRGCLQAARSDAAPYLLFLHGTTWTTKHWPEIYWRRLIELAGAGGWAIRLPWGSADEQARAERLASGMAHVTVLPRLTLGGIAKELAGARACVAVDTGLGHLAAAFDIPTLSLFGPTNPGFTGAWGHNQFHLASNLPCAPCLQRHCTHIPTSEERAQFDLNTEQPLCFTRLDPGRIWHALQTVLAEGVLPDSPPGATNGTSPGADGCMGLHPVFDRKAR
jgi:heptosyltransferase-1